MHFLSKTVPSFVLVVLVCSLFSACQPEGSSTNGKNEKPLTSYDIDFSNTQRFVEGLKSNQISTILLDSIIQKSKYQEKLGAVDSVFFFDSLLLRTSKRANQLDYIAKGQAYLAYDHREANRWDSAYHYYNHAQKSYKLLNDSLQVGRKLLEMGKIQQKQAAYFESKETVTEALTYLDSIDNIHYWGVVHNVLAHNYKKLGDFTMAEKCYQKAIASETKRNNRILYVNNLGLLYREMGDSEKAIKLFRKALQELPEDFVITEKARLEHNLAVSEWKHNQKEPLAIFLNVLAIRKTYKDDWGLISSYHSLFEYFLPKSATIAERYADSLITVSKRLGNPNSEIEVLSKLLTHDATSYASFAPRYIRLKDSLEELRAAFKNQYAYLKYQDEQEKARLLALETETAKNKAELARAQVEKILFLSLIAIVLLGAGALYLLLRQRHKKERLKEVYETEKRIAQELHDGLANNVFGLMTGIEQQTADNDQILDQLETIYATTRSISHDHSVIATGEDLVHELMALIDRHQGDGLSVVSQGTNDITWGRLNEERGVVAHRAIKELLVNLKKHAKASLASFKFSENDDWLHIHYRDNGVGFSNTMGKGVGLKHIEQRLKEVKGSITIGRNQKGAEIEITLPLG